MHNHRKRSGWLPVNVVRKELVIRAMQLAPPAVYPGGWLSTSQISHLIGLRARELRPVLKELKDEKRLNGFHSALAEFWRPHNRMWGDLDG